MKLKLQKRLASIIFKGSKKRVRFETEVLDEIKEGLTKDDVRGMIKRGLITINQKKGVSRVRAKKNASQRAKGLRRGSGKRKGSKNARLPDKEIWMVKIRLQRAFLKELYDKKYLDAATYRNLYKKAKGGFFRSKRHIKIYVDDNKLALKKEVKKEKK
jgi:large subunit ribosomal protein L19e